MHTEPTLNKNQLLAYHAHLQTDHDFRVWADILTMEEKFVSEADILDGQINFSPGTEEGPERTASLTLSDPEGALSFGTSYAEDDTGTLWVNRLLRICHEIDVPGIGPFETVEIRTNYAPNPSLETVLTGWSSVVASWTGARTASASAFHGGYVYRASNVALPGTNSWIVQVNVGSNRILATPGQTVGSRVRFRLRPGIGTRTAQLRLRSYLGTAAGVAAGFATTDVTLTEDWQEVAVTGILPTGADGFGVVLAPSTPFNQWVTGWDYVEADAAYHWLDLDPGPGSFFTGDTTDGDTRIHDWTGTANNSPSTLTVRRRTSLAVKAIGIVGAPTAVAHAGGEIALELGDKSILADHGVRPVTFKKGMRVDIALRRILRELTGERHMRIPVTKKRLSRSYTVGMGEDALTPWQLFKRIAGAEMGWRAYYSCDGYATCEPTGRAKTTVKMEDLLALPDSSTSFTDFVNYAKVTSRRKMKNTKKDKKAKRPEATVIFEGVAVLPRRHDLSEQSLARHEVPRTLPIVIDDDKLATANDVNDRTRSELKQGSDLQSEQSYEIMPVFHLDKGDKIDLPLRVGVVNFEECSIPLGTGGNMTIGKIKWVSKPVKVRRVRSKRTVKRKKKKGGKKN